jgi:ATP-dependent HslUV protease, peptidase subunit HslV
VNGSVLGIVGWSAISDIVEHLITTNPKLFQLTNSMEILGTLLQLHSKMKETYFIETKEEDDQPVESNQLDMLIINKSGVFDICSYRSVTDIATFWAIGSGRRLALGAMHAVYDSRASAKVIVETGVRAAAAFDKSCGLPLKTKTVSVQKSRT